LLPIIDLITDCYDNIDAGAYTCIAILDLKKKAFDTVDHILLKKLEYYGILVEIVTILSQVTYLTENNMMHLGKKF